jgi:hypothetical protein
MTNVVDKVDFYSGLNPGNVFSWFTMKGGPAKFAWVVLDVCLPFKDFKEYEIPRHLHGSRNDPVYIDEIQQIKLFRTLRSPAPNPLTDPDFLIKEGPIEELPKSRANLHTIKNILDYSKTLEDYHSQPEEILWLVKNPSWVRPSKRSGSDTAEVRLIGDALENQIWNALGYAGINRLSARQKYHIGKIEKSWLDPTRGTQSINERGICAWIRYLHHKNEGDHWTTRGMPERVCFWGAGTGGLDIGEYTLDTQEMVGTNNINKVWKW